MKQIGLLISLFILTFFSHAQKLNYQFPEKFNPIYNFHPDKLYQNYAKQNKGEINEQIVCSLYNTQFNFDYNKMYLNWDEAEVYLMRITDTLCSDPLFKDNKINVYISRDPSFYVKYGNTRIFSINVGLLSKVRSEAALAFVIAHEIGHILADDIEVTSEPHHYRYQGISHSYEGYGILDYEIQADRFAMKVIKRLGYDEGEIYKQFEYLQMKSELFQLSRGYENMILLAQERKEAKERKRQQLKKKETKKTEKADTVALIPGKKYLVDSLFFNRLKKSAREECKKIYFDRTSYNQSLELAFIDYLKESKNLKNLYLITESLRRLLYTNPKTANSPFLMNGFEDDEMFYANQSILYKPDYLFTDYDEYTELKNHPLFTSEKKPFNTYKEAFMYFTEIGLKINFNECNLSRALYFYSLKNRDSTNKYLDNYLASNNGLNYEFAKSIRDNDQPSTAKGKTLIVVDNIGNYTFGTFNYYLTKQRAQSNNSIKSVLVKDTANTTIIFMNELLGKEPRNLYQYQKFSWNIQALYNEEDIHNFKKIRLTSKEKQDELGLSHKFNKHFLILSPELYPWFKENNYSTLFFIETIHQSKEYLTDKEAFNTYTGYYLDINAIRPYFKDAVRSGFNVKQKNM